MVNGEFFPRISQIDKDVCVLFKVLIGKFALKPIDII